jgi:spermidine synthase
VKLKKRIFSDWTAALILLLAFAGGAIALAHQLLWTRRMVDLLGASAGSAARVFGCFFLGLALGSFIGGHMAVRVKRPWRWLASAEVGVALLSIPMLMLPAWTAGIWPWLGPERFMGLSGSAIKTILSVLLILPPAAIMGLFIPLALRDWPTTSAGQREPGLWLYAINTAGAVFGLYLVTVWLLPVLPMRRVMTIVIVGNGLAALGCLLIDSLSGAVSMPSRRLPHWRQTIPKRTYLVMAFLSGLLVMAAEVVALLIIQLLAPLSFFAPAAVLASFIGLLALSALVVAARSHRSPINDEDMVRVLIAAGVLTACSPLIFHWLAPLTSFQAGSPSLVSFLVRLSLFTMLVIGPAIFAAGLWFPMIASACTGPAAAHARLSWGWLLAVNGIGGFIGTEVAYLLLLPWLGPYRSMGMIGFLYVLAAWIFLGESSRPITKRLLIASFPVLMGCLFYALPRLPVVHPRLMPAVLDQQHGREGSLVVLEHPAIGRAIMLQNQYVLGATRDREEAERMALLPLSLHARPERVAFIGLATGITAGGALTDARVQEVIAVEIARSVSAAAGKWFADYNRQLLTDPRARVVIEDGRTWLAAHQSEFDVIVSDLFLPWGPGEGRLYTREHFAAAHRALRHEGLFCLWLPMYQLNNDQFMVILHTLLQVFPEIDILLRSSSLTQPALGLVGWKNSRAPMPRDTDFVLGTARRDLVTAPVNTLDNLWIELDAGRQRILHGESAPYLTGARWTPWLEAFQARLVPR